MRAPSDVYGGTLMTAILRTFSQYKVGSQWQLPMSFMQNSRQMRRAKSSVPQRATSSLSIFIRAYCNAAYAHGALYFFGHDRTSSRLALAEAAIQAASRLRPDAGETHLA